MVTNARSALVVPSLRPWYLVRNSHNFMRDILRRKYKIYAPTFDCALRHIRLHGCVEFLRDGNPANFFYAAQCRCPVAIITRDNDSDQFTVPVLREGTQKNRDHVGPSPRL